MNETLIGFLIVLVIGLIVTSYFDKKRIRRLESEVSRIGLSVFSSESLLRFLEDKHKDEIQQNERKSVETLRKLREKEDRYEFVDGSCIVVDKRGLDISSEKEDER